MAAASVLSGSLNDFGLVEVLQVVELGSMTGAIQLHHSNGQEGIIYCNEGKIANSAEFDPGALTLGDVLQQLGMATHAQIEAAFLQQKTEMVGKRIGERLINMRVIDEKQLKEALKTKALWTTRELALWQEGTYQFIVGSTIEKLLPYGEAPLNIEVIRATMEIVRYSDEWQDLRSSLPQGMRTMLRLAPNIPHVMNLHAYIVEILLQINVNHKVRHIASALRRPELEVARDLAQLVRQQLVQCVTGSPDSQSNGHKKVRLPDPAEKLRLEHFPLFNLLSRIEQRWQDLANAPPIEQLPALVEFVNWTMEALVKVSRNKGTELDPNTLRTLLYNEQLTNMGTYEFIVDQNRIDVDDFKDLCEAVLNNRERLHDATDFYDEASSVLQRMLRTIFDSINARIVDPVERVENQEVWEAMFEQFALSRLE